MSDSHDKALAVVERENGARMHPLVQAAIAAGPDPATLRELLAVQREWEAGEAKRAFTRAMVELKRDLPTVLARDQVVDYQSSKGRTYYKHTSLAAAVGAVIEPLTQHGFSHSWTPDTKDRGVSVKCTLTHAEGHSESTTLSAPPDNSGHKNPAQAIASTITLLQRYSLLALLGIATADMKDPTGQQEPAPKQVDQKCNLRAAARLRYYDRTREQAEEFLGRPVAEWTAEDLQRLSEWVTPETEGPPMREPGEEG
jgi:hypothetical protein